MLENLPLNGKEFFIFPESLNTLEYMQHESQIHFTYQYLFSVKYKKEKPDWHLRISISLSHIFPNRLNLQHKIDRVWQTVTVCCSVCTSRIVYKRYHTKTEKKGFHLIQFNNYHNHTTNMMNYIQFQSKKENFSNWLKITRRRYGELPIQQLNLEQIVRSVSLRPHYMREETFHLMMTKNLGIDNTKIRELRHELDKKYIKSFVQLLVSLKEKGCEVRYLPQDLLFSQKNQEINHPEEVRDNSHPDLPNIILIITPEMKASYQQFGHFVGFDLTFGLITERSSGDGQYMAGVFASRNSSNKVIIFGLAITNSQSIYAYNFLFKSFIQIMGKSPSVIITDQQKAMFYSLKHLKRQNIFTGVHLFDMFHILRKFRKSSYDHEIFQLILKLIHVKNRQQYRILFRTIIKHVTNQKELSVLRRFDFYSDKYCYSQIEAQYVGKGISNNINEFFHSQLKCQILRSINYVKFIQIGLQFIQRRFEYSRWPILLRYPIEKTIYFQQLTTFRTKLSQKVLTQVIKEFDRVSKCKILKISEYKRYLLCDTEPFSSEKNQYFIQDDSFFFRVYKERRENLQSKRSYKWICCCRLEERAGHFCSHIARVIMTLGLDFTDNIHPRLLIKAEDIEKKIIFDRFMKTSLNSRTERNLIKSDKQTKAVLALNPKQPSFDEKSKPILEQKPIIEEQKQAKQKILEENSNNLLLIPLKEISDEEGKGDEGLSKDKIIRKDKTKKIEPILKRNTYFPPPVYDSTSLKKYFPKLKQKNPQKKPFETHYNHNFWLFATKNAKSNNLHLKDA